MKNVYSHSLKILSSQRDSLFRLRLDDALKLFQDIATFHAHELGIDGPQLMKKDNAFWIVTRTIIHCHAIPVENEDITAKTWPLPTNGLRCERCYTLSQNDEIKIAGVSEWVVIDAETRHPRRIESTHFPTDIDYQTERAVTTSFTKMKDDFDNDDFVYDTVIRSTDIDITHHTNNSVYCSMLLDTFSVKELEKIIITDLEISYHKESLEGEKLRVFRKNDNGMSRFAIKKEDGTLVVLAEMKYIEMP